MIEISNLNKYYKSKGDKVHVLKDINIRIADKERVAILGKSGAGKSTLLHIMGLLNISCCPVHKSEHIIVIQIDIGFSLCLIRSRLTVSAADLRMLGNSDTVFG